jgi:hypothetical protein
MQDHLDFGLVWVCLTNRYHSPDLGTGQPCGTFTKHYHRDGGLTTELDI